MQLQEQDDQWLKAEPVIQPTSIFQKQIVVYSDSDIQRNIDQRMKTPIYNIELHQLQQEDEKSQQNELQHDLFKGNTMFQGQRKENTEKTQALFNPLQDEQNQIWMKKCFKKVGRSLCCPSCFNQIAFNYTISEQSKDEIVYSTFEIFSAEVKQNAIVRQQNVSDKMVWIGAQSQKAQLLLKQREEEFNIKIIVQCNCGNVIGYYDINKECYMLTNVI